MCVSAILQCVEILTRIADQSRKRGTLESDLLMSTFAEAHLRDMTEAQLAQFDLFLDENDWDIYYWATQQTSQTSRETAEGAGFGDEGATANAAGNEFENSGTNEVNAANNEPGGPSANAGAGVNEPVGATKNTTGMGRALGDEGTTKDVNSREPQSSIGHAPNPDAGEQTGPEPVKPQSGEWAQTIGTFKPAYRPVPARWRNSEILAMLRRHVVSRSAGGIHEDTPGVGGKSLGEKKGGGGGGK